ncbi:MAG: ZIP family metal transporter [Clostridia bacterium]|nr:ZIP family metal transporter [Clostridia bacterium]
MLDILTTSFLGLVFGSIGTLIGGFIGISLKRVSNKFLSFILSVASGIMTSIICFDLIPEASKISKMNTIVFGLFIGILTMIFCDIVVNNKLKPKINKMNTLLKTGIVLSIGLALHNIPEGLAISTSFENSIKLGYALAITIAIHDVPEGISMSAPLKKSGISNYKILLYVLLSGIATGVGAFIGALVGNVSEKIIALSLSFAAGTMLYVVYGELTPEYSKLQTGSISSFGNILGFVLGYVATHLC